MRQWVVFSAAALMVILVCGAILQEKARDTVTITYGGSSVAPAPQHHRFSGQVYVDGALAPPGSILIADIGGSTFGQTTIGDDGQYSIDVRPSSGVGRIIEWLYSADGQACCLLSTTASTFTAGGTDTLDLPFFTPTG
jgi:hypothetical protein